MSSIGGMLGHPVPGLLQRGQVRPGGLRGVAGLRGGTVRYRCDSGGAGQRPDRLHRGPSRRRSDAGRRASSTTRPTAGRGQGGGQDGRGRGRRGGPRRRWPTWCPGCSRPSGRPGGSRWASSTSGSGSPASASSPTASSSGRPRVASASDHDVRPPIAPTVPEEPKEAGHGQPPGPAGAGGRALRPPDRRHLRHRRGQRPVVDREGLCHGRPPGREPAAGIRHGQVHQPQRARRLRRGVPGCRAGHRAGQPAAVPRSGRPRPSGPSATRCSSPCSGSASRSSPTSASRWPSTGSTRRSCRRRPRTAPTSGRPSATGSVPSWSGTTRSARRRAGWSSTATATRSRPTSGSRPGTTPGACATTWARPPTDVDPFNPVAEMDFQMIWCPVLMADPDGTRWGLFMHLVDDRAGSATTTAR